MDLGDEFLRCSSPGKGIEGKGREERERERKGREEVRREGKGREQVGVLVSVC